MLLRLFALVAAVSAALVPSAPIQSTTWDARVALTVEWRDNGKAPPLNLTGKVGISLWTGGIKEQTFLAPLTQGRYINPTRLNTSISIPRDVGPDGHYYFLQFVAPDSMDDPVYTGRFTLTHMTGEFNQTVLAQLATLNASTLSTSSVAKSTTGPVSLSTAVAAAVSSASSSSSTTDSSDANALRVSAGLATSVLGLVALACAF